MWSCCATRSRPASGRTDDRCLSAIGFNHRRPRTCRRPPSAALVGRPGGRPRPGGAVRGRQPRLPARIPRLPGRPRTVLGRLVHLRAVRGGRVHRAVGLLAGPVTGPPRLATRRGLRVRAPAGPAHPAGVLRGPCLQPRRRVADRPSARAGGARREVGRRQRPAGAEPRRRANPRPIVLVDRRRGPAVRRVPSAAGDGAPMGRRRHGRHRDAHRGGGGDLGRARLRAWMSS